MDTSNHDDGYESCTDSEEEEEEEMMFLVFPTIYCISSRREKIPVNTSILTELSISEKYWMATLNGALIFLGWNPISSNFYVTILDPKIF